MSLRIELSVTALVSSFFSLYPVGRNALISWTTKLIFGFIDVTVDVTGFIDGVVDVILVSAISVDVVCFEEGHLK